MTLWIFQNNYSFRVKIRLLVLIVQSPLFYRLSSCSHASLSHAERPMQNEKEKCEIRATVHSRNTCQDMCSMFVGLWIISIDNIIFVCGTLIPKWCLTSHMLATSGQPESKRYAHNKNNNMHVRAKALYPLNVLQTISTYFYSFYSVQIAHWTSERCQIHKKIIFFHELMPRVLGPPRDTTRGDNWKQQTQHRAIGAHLGFVSN